MQRRPDFHGSLGSLNCVCSIGACFVLCAAYVASLYIWSSPHNRDHPSTIKRRFLSVTVMMAVSPAVVYAALRRDVLEQASLWQLMGVRTAGLAQAVVVPLLLTMVLFLGPLAMRVRAGAGRAARDREREPEPAHSLIWWRNHVVAPLSEEFTFRACMLPVLLQCLGPRAATAVCPLFFGVAHFHHAVEKVRGGVRLRTALLVSGFQFLYTTVFGAYSAYLFVRTGHLAASCVAHSFCNLMGFPDLSELAGCRGAARLRWAAAFVAGLVLWAALLQAATQPRLYHNHLFWADRDRD